MWIFLDWIAFVFLGELRHGINAILCDEVILNLNENILYFLTSLSYFCYELLCVFRKYADGMWAHCHPSIHKPHKVMSSLKEGFASSRLRHRGMDRLLGQYSDAYLILLLRPKDVFNSSRCIFDWVFLDHSWNRFHIFGEKSWRISPPCWSK